MKYMFGYMYNFLVEFFYWLEVIYRFPYSSPKFLTRVKEKLSIASAIVLVELVATLSGGCTPRATRAMARGSAQKIVKEAQKIAEEE